MTVGDIRLKGFRNYTDEEASFSPETNIIIGGNAQGKTNMLEALYYLASGKSFRARYDRDVIGFDKEYADISAGVNASGRDQKIDILIRRGAKKKITVNGAVKKTPGTPDLITAVLFSPDDLYIIKEGSAARRRLLDMCISQLRPRYASLLSSYTKTYEGKSRILRDRDVKPSLLGALDDYDVRLAQLSANIIRYRAYFADMLAKYAKEIQSEFSAQTEELTVKYKTVSTIDDPFRPADELFEKIMEHQAAHKKAELETGTCLTGAHKDDLDIFINGTAAKSFGSQGQIRTAALSLKLAEREIHRAETGESPILLLDDVLSELDVRRKNFVLNKIGGGQVFITCCEEKDILPVTDGRIISISNGHVLSKGN